MINIIKFSNSDICGFLGKNGYGKCTGLEIYNNGNKLTIYPITSREVTGRGYVQIPVKDIQLLIDELEKLKA